MSILPWVIIESSSGDELYLTIAAMSNSNDEQINGLAQDLGFMNICFWSIIIFGLIIFVGILIHLSGKYFNLSRIIMFAALKIQPIEEC